jgi:glycoprotein endo-alpha-1,2-mannosidase
MRQPGSNVITPNACSRRSEEAGLYDLRAVRLLTSAATKVFGLLLLAAITCSGAEDREQLLKQRDEVKWTAVPRQVLSFYYGWYGNPTVSGRWVHWEKVDEAKKTIGSSSHYPTLGAYDSHDPKIVEQHCKWAKEAGITGFIATWWGQGDFHDKGMPLLLNTAEKNGLKVTVYFETVHRDGALKDVLYLLEHYAKHPAWLKVNGKPVLFVYGRAVGEIKPDGWLEVISEANKQFPGGAVFIGDQISKNAARIFDGIHTYNPTGSTAHKSAEQIRAWAHTTYPKWVETAGPNRIACVTVIPGYDDTTQGRPAPRPITERHDGKTYEAMWEEAIAANPDWVLITTWNEWHEGSEIEPSVEDGDRALKATPGFAKKFLEVRPRGR